MTVGLLLMAEGPSSPSISIIYISYDLFFWKLNNNIVNRQSQDHFQVSALRRIDFRGIE